MTDLAGRGESRRRMGWIVRAGVVFLVARVAQDAIQGIVVVDVAIATEPRRHSVRARELKAGGCVVEFAVGPEHGVVAGLACSWESRRDMIYRRGRGVVVLLMARNASRRRDVVVIVGVAIAAQPRRHRMISRERKAGAVVVERRVQPGQRAVA